MSSPWPPWIEGATEVGRGCRLLVSSCLAFSLMTVCVKQLGGRLPVSEIVFVRSLISIVLTLISLQSLGISAWGERRGLLLVRGLLGTVALLFFFEAISNLPLAAATVLQYTYPTFTALAAWLLLGERIRRRIGLAVLLGWLGITLVVQPEWIGAGVAGLPLSIVLIALGGALFTALAYVSVRALSRNEHPMVIVFYFPLVSIPVTLPLLWNQVVWPLGIEWILLLGVGVFTQLGQVWLTKGLKLLPAAQASSINYVQVLFASILGVIIFAEPVDGWMAMGALCVLGATLISLSAKQPQCQATSVPSNLSSNP